MRKQIPTVPWRWGEKYKVTEFIQNNNQAILEIASYIKEEDKSPDDIVLNLSHYIRDNFFYPLNNIGNPSTSGSLLRYRFSLCKFHFKKSEDYIWGLPCEIVNYSCGYCAETANLATSILIAIGIPNSWVVLGEIRRAKDNSLLGYHAWVECPYQGKQHVMETTVDEKDVNILSPTSSAYQRCSDWAIQNNIYYIPQSRYNESEYVGEGPLAGNMVFLMGMPAKRVLIMGFDRTVKEQRRKPRKIRSELNQEARIVTRLLLEAYRKG